MCAGVRFEIAEPLLGALYCHCKRCQRRTGCASSATAATTPHSFRIIQGAELVASWRPPDGWEKFFCLRCGSRSLQRDPKQPERLSVRMGAFDEDPGIRPSVRRFVDDAAGWETIPADDLPRFPARLPAGVRPPQASGDGFR